MTRESVATSSGQPTEAEAGGDRECLATASVAAFVAGKPVEDREAIERHLSCCPACFACVAAAARCASHADHEQTPDATDLRVVQEIPGRYYLTVAVGRGGQATVFAARDSFVGRDVAFKVLWRPEMESDPSSHSDETRAAAAAAEARFLREVRILAGFSHPTIVDVYEVGRRADGRLYYTMPLIRGRTLAECLHACQSLRERMALLGHFGTVCEGIAYAHGKGVLHRDIKPGNVMIGEYGETRILDWGLARAHVFQTEPAALDRAQPASFCTEAGVRLGTVQYMSPEQASGAVESLDERSDVWSLGAVLHEILTGRPPRDATEVHQLHVACREPVPTVRSREPDAPPELAAIADMALRIDPAARYPDARQLAADISAFMTGARVSAYPYTSWELLRQSLRRHRGLVAALGAILVTLATALVVVSLSYQNARQAREQETAARQREHAENLAARYHLAQAQAARAAELLRGRDHLAARVYAQGSLENHPGNPRSATYQSGFEPHEEGSAMLMARAASIIYQAGFGMVAGLDRRLEAGQACSEVAWSPQGTWLAMGGADGKLQLWRAGSFEPAPVLLVPEGHALSVAFSPDGHQIAAAGRTGDVHVWRVDSWEQSLVLRGAQAPTTGVAFAPDGSFVAAAGRRGAFVWDAASGAVRHVINAGTDIADVVVTSDSSRVILGRRDGVLEQWRVSAHQPVRERTRVACSISRLKLSRDGSAISVSCSEGGLSILSVPGLESIRALEGRQGSTLGTDFSPDGSWIAAATQNQSLGLWQVANGSLLASIGGHREAVLDVAVSPDSKSLVSCGFDRNLLVWNLRTPSGPVRLAGHRGVVYDAAWSPDGAVLASAGQDGMVRTWDARTGTPGATLPPAGVALLGITFSPSGTHLACSAQDGSLRIASLSDSSFVRRLEGGTSPLFRVAWSPDGDHVVAAGIDGAVKLWSANSGELREFRGHRDVVYDVAFSEDGQRLASAGADGTVRVWSVRGDTAPVVIRAHADWASGVHFSPDGKHLVSGGKDSSVKVWDPESGTEQLRLAHHRQWVNKVRFSPDGSLIASASDDRTAVLSSAQTGRPLLILDEPASVAAVAFSPDGKTLAVATGDVVELWPVRLPGELDPTAGRVEAERHAGIELAAWDWK